MLKSMTGLSATLVFAASAGAAIALIAWLITRGARISARDRRLDAEAIQRQHDGQESAFQIAPEIEPHRYATCPTCQAGDYCAEGLYCWLAVSDEMAKARASLADDVRRLRQIEQAANPRTQASADAMARALGALCPLIWGADAKFADATELWTYVALEATIHAPQPRPLSALSDSHVGVDWDAALKLLLLTEEAHT